MTLSSEKKPSKKVSLAERKAQLQSRLAQLEARERDARRKEATRVRVVLGAVLLAQVTKLVEQRDTKAAGFVRFLRELSNEISRPADAPARAALIQLLSDMENELVKPPLAKQSLSAAPKPAQPPAPLQGVQEPAQPSPAHQPAQMHQRPPHASTEPSQRPLGAWSKPITSS